MRRFLDNMAPHCPAALLFLFAGWSGSFPGGADGAWVLVGHVALLSFVTIWGRAWPDPLRLGRAGNLLLAAFVVSLAASALTSSVPRAGKLGLLLLPVFLLVPSAVASCWSTVEARRAGARSVALVVTAIAGWSLMAWWRFGTPGTSMPLGHHNLLAAWLLVVTPLAAAAWGADRLGRVLAAGAVGLSLISLLASRSLGAALAVGAVAMIFAMRHRAGRFVLLAAGLLAGLQAPRILTALAGDDFSVIARWSYLEAGWRGLWQRPMLGWGPGAASWTISEHLRPIPGAHPPDQVVADLHCWPLELAYELGWTGLVLICGLILAFWRRPAREVVDPDLRRCAALGLGALAIMSFTGLRLAVAALPLAATMAMGAVVASEAPDRSRRRGVALFAGSVVLAIFIVPLDLAHMAYDRATEASGEREQLHHLRRAAQLDPELPLYRARLAWLAGDAAPGDAALARQARAAADDAYGLAPLWLAAGIRGQEAGEPWSQAALLRACQLSPLGAIAPFRLALSDAPPSQRVHWMGRALMAEPRLLVANALVDEQWLLDQAVEELRQVAGVEAWWPLALEERYGARQLGSPTRQLALQMDAEGSTSVSLHAFRRWPWPTTLARVDLAATNLAELGLDAASRLRTTDPGAFEAPLCSVPIVAARGRAADPDSR